MAEPQTVNCGIIVPNTGDLVGTWGSAAVNPDFVAIDGYFGGVQTVSASNAPIVLTSPSGFTPTPSGGPTQAQNAVVRFSGALTSNVQVTLPLPGPIVIENLTTGAFVLSFRAIGSGQVVAVDQGEIQTLYNDGTNVRFINLGKRIGEIAIWGGLSAIPAWVTACTVPPFLLCDGTVYNFTAYPYLGARLGSSFGGNGTTTFGVPDLRGRVALPYDGTGSRITTSGCGINGQSLGAAQDEQVYTLTASQLPGLTSTGVNGISVTTNSNVISLSSGGFGVAGSSSSGNTGFQNTPNNSQVASSGNNTITVSTVGTGGLPHPNVQPSQVTGIAVIRAA